MSNILVLRSSVSGAGSVSNALVDEALAALRAADPQAAVINRDLAATPVPHLGADAFAGVRGAPANDEQVAARALSETLIAELLAADILLIGAPMYNFGLPTQLKSWFDYVLRPGVAFKYTETGPQGLLKDKRAIAIFARGGLYSEGPYKALDAQEPHLRALLAFMGITEISAIHAERLAMGDQARAAGLEKARSQIAAARIAA
jgi:FMN-dependent NADH-azoreductase